MTDNFHRGIPLTTGMWEQSDLVGGETDSVIPTRVKILQQALEIVTKDRNQDYGNPEDNFQVIAQYWYTYLGSRGLIDVGAGLLTSADVAAMMILMKCSRLATSPNKLDHWVDIAGYSSCGGECANGNSR